MNINLEQFVGKEVTVTLRDGDVLTGTIELNSKSGYYPFKLSDCMWGPGGYYLSYDCQHPKDIVKIEKIVETMSTYRQLLQSIKDTEQQLAKLKEQLESEPSPSIQDAEVGDTLEDGSIVLKKENGLALVAAPKSTEVSCPWSKEFSEVFDRLASQGFIPSQWFVPTVEQLNLAYKVIPKEFNKTWYWSSSEFIASNACCVSFFNGYQCSLNKSNTSCVRSVRCVSY
jgi:hypothetical protein